MKNIENIEKDWEVHCAEYGFKSFINLVPAFDKAKQLELSINIDKYASWSEITIDLDDEPDIDVKLCRSEKVYYKCLISFYEKLIKEQDND